MENLSPWMFRPQRDLVAEWPHHSVKAIYCKLRIDRGMSADFGSANASKIFAHPQRKRPLEQQQQQ